ncbi:ParM/StbA family protein [Elusimicrobiota bacterium]
MGKDLNGCVPVGGELGTSTTKFCADKDVVSFSSVVGEAMTEMMEKSWRLMNRSSDKRWIRNLAIFDDKKNAWRYVGAMTRNSPSVNWFTSQGLVQNYDDAFVGIQAALFCLNTEREGRGESPLEKVSLGFGITVRLGENTADKFFDYLKGRIVKENGKKYLVIKAKNMATDEVREIRIQMVSIVIQYQAYGAYMAMLFKKFNMKVFNTYVIDIGHGTWIKLPIIGNEADLNLSDSLPEGMHTITQNISTVIFESSKEKFKIPEQRIMEKLSCGEYQIEIPGVGVYDFKELLDKQCDVFAQKIMQKVRGDISQLSRRGEFLDYFTVIGGGAHLLFDRIRDMLAQYYEWPDKTVSQRIVRSEDLGLNPRYINCVGFMLVARDQLAVEQDQEVDPEFSIERIITDF